jgi:hypothetical protein
VRLGACEIAGPLRVPAGARLEGVAGTVIVAGEGTAGVVLAPGLGADATELASVEVRVEGLIGVLARGAGSVALEQVRIEVVRGIGVGLSGLTTLSLDSVTIAGPVTAATATSPEYLRVVAAAPPPGECPGGATCECEPGETGGDGRVCDASGAWATVGAAYGLYLDAVADADLRDVEVSGMAAFGVVSRGGLVRWTGGELAENLGVGLRQIGGEVVLEDVAVRDTLQGVRGEPSYAIATTDAARIESIRLTLVENERFGLLQFESAGSHEDLVAEGNGDAAVWVGASDDFALRGTGTSLADNSFAGLVVAGSRNVRIEDAVIEATRTVERPVGTFGVRQIGDGIHLSDSLVDVALARVILRANGRAGLVADLGAGSAGIAFTGVTVEGSGSELGAVAGRSDGSGHITPVAMGGWDDGITRLGATAANDATLPATMDAVGTDRPSEIPGIGELAVIAPMF